VGNRREYNRLGIHVIDPTTLQNIALWLVSFYLAQLIPILAIMYELCLGIGNT